MAAEALGNRLLIRSICCFLCLLLTALVALHCSPPTEDQRIAACTERIHGGDSLAYLERSRLFLAAGRTNEALNDVNLLIEKGVVNDSTLGLRGLIFLDMNAPDYAILDFSECITLGSWKFHLMRGLAHMRSRSFRLAVSDFRSFARRAQEDHQDSARGVILDPSWRCNVALGEYTAAIRDLRELKEQGSQEVIWNLALCYSFLGKYSSAQAIIDSALADSTTPEIDKPKLQYFHGILSGKMNRLSEAQTYMLYSASSNELKAPAYYQLATYCELLGDTVGSNLHLSNAIMAGFVFEDLLINLPRLQRRYTADARGREPKIVRHVLSESIGQGKILSWYQAESARSWMLYTLAEEAHAEEYSSLFGSLILWDEERVRYNIVEGSFPYLGISSLVKDSVRYQERM